MILNKKPTSISKPKYKHLCNLFSVYTYHVGNRLFFLADFALLIFRGQQSFDTLQRLKINV